MSRGRMASCSAVVLGLGLMSIGSAAVQERKATDTPAELVATYNSLADTILAAKRSEEHLVRSILATTHAHAELAVQRARGAIEAKQADAAGRHLEELATLVGQLGTEGDNSIAAVRKRLLEGGHHHNAEGEKQGVFDPGYVIVTRTAKQVFLDASRAIGRLARSPDAKALDAEWAKVQAAWTNLMKGEAKKS